MAGGKQTPRQKMINLMYLVFIAMLAIQVDRQVLRSFESVNSALTQSNVLASKNNDDFMTLIETKANEDPTGYGEVSKQANGINQVVDKVITVINKVKTELDAAVGYKPPTKEEESDYNSLSNSDAITKILFEDETTNTPLGNDLVSAIKEYNAYLDQVAKTNPKSKAGDYKIDMYVYHEAGEGKQSWLNATFYGQPMIAAKTTLTKYESDIRTAQGNIIRTFLSTKLLEDIEINEFKGVISSPGFVKTGSKVQTFAALGAFDNRLNGTAVVNGTSYPLVDGKATIPLDASSPGARTLQGSMTFKDAKGNTQTVKLDPMTYEVVDEVISKAEFMGVVTAEKMNVVYIGLDNPLAASVSGVQPGSITLSGPGVSNRGGGKGSIRPSGGGTVTVTVSGKTSAGRVVSQGTVFRVKNIPPPQGQIRGQNVLGLPATSLPNQVVTAAIPDFLFDASFNVTQFKVKVPGKATQIVNGSSLGGASSLFSGLRPGDVVNVFDIKTTTNLGIQTKPAAPIVITIR